MQLALARRAFVVGLKLAKNLGTVKILEVRTPILLKAVYGRNTPIQAIVRVPTDAGTVWALKKFSKNF